jgi:ADP-heptose:LPS heptosyltransferase
VLETTLETIPAKVPYLSASRAKREFWAARLHGSAIKIGLVWAGNSSTEHNRSCPLEKFMPLLKCDNVQFFGLQKGEAAAQVHHLPVDMINLGEGFKSFADTAAAIDCLDLVISVDTAVAHLAGAMAKPVWLLLPYAADWKWLLDRMDSPWYPTMRLFRQPLPGDWEAVIQMVAAELSLTPHKNP